MIGHLSGRVLSVGADTAIIDVGGVGYEVSCAPRTLQKFVVGETVSVAVETLVAETFIKLVAFEAEDERRCFRMLQSVQGVGSKAALAILQVLKPGALLDAISLGDKAAVARAQGVGPKLATRIVTELKDKTNGIFAGRAPISAPEASEPAPSGAGFEAVSALVNLGYDEAAARAAVTEARGDGDAPVEALIPAALKLLAPK
ncbi:Holliday junction branch migration protein RuvA [Parvularcula sp. ZS-1/3]|uniref:Holliday junction branch migration complex subunit RuvA n=1 Tax=Parvularcula mediterranea TaxID=2732508 RepID=A0A7Y3W4Y3_9PROT|nr:Holliday junction branch migration protein RuvA [Parvularcula mediterranea]NNU16044.1 Holliday junction branch migration protein RuvA [Parvularcula mediterranea]